MATLAPRTASASAAVLAPSTDVQIQFLFGYLLELLSRGRCAKLFHNLTLSLLNKGREFGCTIVRNFDVRRGAPNPHGGDRSVNFHVASFRYFASNKSKRSLA